MNGDSDNAKQQRIIDGSAWAQFCDELKSAGDIIKRCETPGDAFNRAEGFRYLTRLLRAGLESFVESSDPRFPRFFQLANDTVKIGNDNPDNIYLNANLSGLLNYKITGTRGTVDYISFGTKAGSYADNGLMEPTGELRADDLLVDDDGHFTVMVSRNPQPVNWLPMCENTSTLVVRQTFKDRQQEIPATFDIQCLDHCGDNFLNAAQFADQLQRSVNFVKNTANLFVDWMERYRRHINQLPSDDQLRCQRAGGDSGVHYLQSFWQLADDEALLVRAATIPNCTSWNFQLSNYWMESLDYRYYTVCINKHNAEYQHDGSVVLVVAHQNPGKRYPNWLNTAGHRQGGMLFRWIQADEHPSVDCEVVKFARL